MEKSYEARTAALLALVRKNMNGAVLDTVRYYGADYGVNYGVAIHTLRDMARAVAVESEDPGFVRHLLLRPERELKIVGLWMGGAEGFDPNDTGFWHSVVFNSEMAEQLAQAVLAHSPQIEQTLHLWCDSGECGRPLLAYAALLGGGRSAAVSSQVLLDAVERAVCAYPDNRLIAQAAAAACQSLTGQAGPQLQAMLACLPATPTVSLLREEMEWRLVYK